MSDALTPEQRELALKLIENPPLGSDLEKAKRWGVDLHALVDNLCLTPTERIRKVVAADEPHVGEETAQDSNAQQKKQRVRIILLRNLRTN